MQDFAWRYGFYSKDINCLVVEPYNPEKMMVADLNEFKKAFERLLGEVNQ